MDDFTNGLMAAGGYPLDAANVIATCAWALSEDDTLTRLLGCNNPLAVLGERPDRPRCPGTIVDSYISLKEGITYTHRRLLNGLYNDIIKAYETKIPEKPTHDQVLTKLDYIWFAINQSPWCRVETYPGSKRYRPCQHGKYPIALWMLIHGSQAGSPAPPVNIPPAPHQAPPQHEKLQFVRAWHALTVELRVVLPRQIRKIEDARRQVWRNVR
jgi:hypothetical protein